MRLHLRLHTYPRRGHGCVAAGRYLQTVSEGCAAVAVFGGGYTNPPPKRRDDTLQTLTAPLTPSPHAHESRRTGRCWRHLSTPQQKPDMELLELLSKGLSAGVPSCMRNTRHYSDATAMPQSRMRWSPGVAQPKPAAIVHPGELICSRTQGTPASKTSARRIQPPLSQHKAHHPPFLPKPQVNTKRRYTRITAPPLPARRAVSRSSMPSL